MSNLVSFEPDKIDVYLDGKQLQLEPGQTVIPHGVDRGLDTDEVLRQTPYWERTMKALFEVVILPVSDPDRSLRFYRDFRDPEGNAWVLQERSHEPT